MNNDDSSRNTVQASSDDASRRPGDEARPGSPQTGENICPKCQGDGRSEGKQCDSCGGTGRIVGIVGDA